MKPMTLIERYEVARKLLNNYQLKREAPEFKLDLRQDVQEAIGFLLALLGGLQQQNYEQEGWEVYGILFNYREYIQDQLMLIICKGMEIPRGMRAFVALNQAHEQEFALEAAREYNESFKEGEPDLKAD